MNPSASSGLRGLAGALLAHVERALAARLPVLQRVIELSEREVLAAVLIVQNINQESKHALAELEVVASCLSPVKVKGTPASLGASIAEQELAHQRFESLCGTTKVKLDEQEQRASKATVSVKRILNIVAEVDAVAQRAVITTFNARIESAHLGVAGRTFDVIADELRDMTAAIQSLNVDIKAMGEELMKVIPVMASEASELRASHTEVSASLGKHMAEVGDSQRRALTILNAAVVAGRTRTDSILGQSHEVMARLQFQDRVSQDVGALINQEQASAGLIERSLLALDADDLPDAAAIEREARSIEVIRHGKAAADKDDASTDDAPNGSAAAAGELMLF